MPPFGSIPCVLIKYVDIQQIIKTRTVGGEKVYSEEGDLYGKATGTIMI